MVVVTGLLSAHREAGVRDGRFPWRFGRGIHQHLSACRVRVDGFGLDALVVNRNEFPDVAGQVGCAGPDVACLVVQESRLWAKVWCESSARFSWNVRSCVLVGRLRDVALVGVELGSGHSGVALPSAW